MSYFICGRGEKKQCQSPCRQTAVGECQFELRGVAEGRKCKRSICDAHSKIVGGKRVCLPHARMTSSTA